MTRRYQSFTKNVPLAVATAAYSLGDVIGGCGLDSALFEISLSDVSVTVLLDKVRLYDDGNKKADLTLHFFDEAPAALDDLAPFALSFTDLKKLIGSVNIPVGAYRENNGNAYARVSGKDELTVSDHGHRLESGTVWIYVVTNEIVQYGAATDLHLDLDFLLDV